MLKRSKRIIDEDLNIIGRLSKRKNEYGEYVIRGYEDGKRCEDADYFTDDWEDAVNTAKAVAKQRYGKLEQIGSGYVIYGVSLDETRDRRYSTKDSVDKGCWFEGANRFKLYVFKGVCYYASGEDEKDNFSIDHETYKIIAENEKQAVEKLLRWMESPRGDESHLSYDEIIEYDWGEAALKYDIIY